MNTPEVAMTSETRAAEYAEGLSVLLFGFLRMRNASREAMVDVLIRSKESPANHGFLIDAARLGKDGKKALKAVSDDKKS